jgi:hypothetical protein
MKDGKRPLAVLSKFSPILAALAITVSLFLPISILLAHW